MTTLNELTAALSALRVERKAAAAQVKLLEEQEKVIERDVLRLMEDSGADRMDSNGLKLLRVLESVLTPDPEHWQDIFQWIADNDHWQLVRKQLNLTAALEITRAGYQIPFTEPREFTKLKVTDVR